ncbi:ubiquinol-cytochrome c reductase iron-sulfur subunit [Pyxidicoccus sp. MSG2]|uniref:QcrA and Rieske domain-containing protein n=1 Tax=Pyxidicoccus sp. MSG2 TaxID=2996790 RepID=UPI002270231E|nr:Rieske 2Fe-2S domain-containing protein [Pyxidicoccus sp. MSG2]MCY1018404.1 Rieske 2Fe-2S domain-containing protein [Pyxidicoccus sp. MSG2]
MSTSRRGFLKGVLGTGAAGAASAALPGCAPDINPAPVTDVTASAAGTVDLLVPRYPDLEPVGGAITVRVPGQPTPLLLAHTKNDGGSDDFSTVSSICTHVGCPLGFDGKDVVCPCHLSKFNPRDGSVLQRPATTPLRSFKTTYNPGTRVVSINVLGGDTSFPSVVNGQLTLPFSQFPDLRNNGSSVTGVPSGYGLRIFVFRLEDGTLSAVDSTCTHQQCEVEFNAAESDLVCPCHDSAFTRQGEMVRGHLEPNGSRLPNPPLKKFTVSETADAVIVSGVR